ncbi:MAG: hypothetical protein LAP39_01535 [Acidobacteriia bacterium]|nr:hypothetical protein [Terriglobia bacterium]
MKKLAILALICLAQTFAEDNTATTFRSTCFSNVCIGDDLDKVMQAQPHWLTAHIKSSDDDQAVIHLRDLTAVRKKYGAVISKSYHDLNAADLAKLSDNFLDGGYTGEAAPYTRLMESLAKEKSPFIVADSSVLPILKKATLCGLLPVHGVFVSESGLYTGVLMLPVAGKLTVVQMKRLFDLHIPVDAPDAEKEHIIFDRVADMVKQIDAKYGTHWDTSESGAVQNESRAVGDDIEASLTLDRNSLGRRAREIEPLMSLYRRDFENSAWQSTKWSLDDSLAATKGCEVKAKALVAIE